MAQQYFLDLARIDVAAAADNHVLRPVAQGQKPVFVEATEIAGVQPAAAQRLCRRFRVVPVGFHDTVSASLSPAVARIASAAEATARAPAPS